MSRFVHEALNIMLQFFVVSIIEDRHFFSCFDLLMPVTLSNARTPETLQFLHQGMSNSSFLPTCPELLVARVLSAGLQRSPAYPALLSEMRASLFNC